MHVEKKVMATGGEKQDENDQASDRGKMCFVVPPLTFLLSLIYICIYVKARNFFWLELFATSLKFSNQCRIFQPMKKFLTIFFLF